MRSKSRWIRAGMLAFTVALVSAVAALPAGAQDDAATESDVLRIGWGQDPQTLNPFVGLDEEDFTVWGLTWDLLVNFSPEDLSPTAGIAESWEVSDDQKTVTFTLDPDRTWSDGEPVTSADVKWSLETLGSEGDLFTSYTTNVTSIETPDDQTVVINTKVPDARIVGGLFIYILPQHIWGEVPLEEVTTTYKPEIPMVGSGPYIVTEFERGRILRMEVNPEWTGEEPAYEEIQFIKYGTEDAVERALQLGEIDIVAEVQPATFDRLGEQADIDTFRGASPSLHGARVQPLLRGELPGRRVQPGGTGQDRPPGDRVFARPPANHRHLVARAHRSPATRDPALVLQVVLRGAGAALPAGRRACEPDAGRRRLGAERRRAALEGRESSCRSTCTSGPSPSRTSRRRSWSPSRPPRSASSSTSRS